MNKLIFTLNVFILLSASFTQSMEIQTNNSDCPLPNFKLEDELIFACCLTQPKKSPIESRKALKYTIKIFINMRSTCKEYHEYLTFEKIGNFCKNHSTFARNAIFHETTFFPQMYYCYRPVILILIHANARFEEKQDKLLEHSIDHNDAYMLKTLLTHKVNLHEKREYKDPLIFSAKTVEIAEILMKNGVDLHTSRDTGYNFLSDLLRRNPKYSSTWTKNTLMGDDGAEFSFEEGSVETEYICPTDQSTWDLIELCLNDNVVMRDEDRELYDKFTSQLPTIENITNNHESVACQKKTIAASEESEDLQICIIF